MKKKKLLSENDRHVIRQFHGFFKAYRHSPTGIKEMLPPIEQQAKEVLQSFPEWKQFHGLSESQLITESTLAFEKVGISISHVTTSDSPQFVLDEMSRLLKDGLDEETRSIFDQIDPKNQAMLLSLHSAIQSEVGGISMFAESLNDLLERAEDSDEALFDAVRVDPAAIRHPNIDQKIGDAEALNDIEFLEELAASISKSKARRREGLDEMRIMVALVDKLFDITTLTDDELVDIFQRDLKVIGEEDGDSLDAIKWHIRKWKKSQ
jgi:hypothetical protein